MQVPPLFRFLGRCIPSVSKGFPIRKIGEYCQKKAKIDEGQKRTHLLRSPEAEKNVRPVSFDGCRTGIPDEMAATAKLYDGPKFQK